MMLDGHGIDVYMLGVPRAAVVVAFLERFTVALEQDRVGVSEDARECALRDFG